MDYVVKEGNYEKLGVQHTDDAVTFTFEGEKEDVCSILFYDKHQTVTTRLTVPADYCRGSIRSVTVQGISWKNLRYNFEINGKVITDTYAERIIGRERWNDRGRAKNGYAVCGGCIPGEFDWQKDRQPEVPRSRMVMYKLHVRGFSMDEEPGSGLSRREKGTFFALAEKIPYLKELGVTTLELMPAYEFEELVLPAQPVIPEYLKWESKEEDLIKPKDQEAPERVNYWGYVPGNYFAPKASYSSSPDASGEFKELVRKLHENGMECVMEFFFDDRMNQNVILDVLRFWVREYHVDGFHLLGGSVPVTAAAQDLLLSRTKLFYTGFDPMLLETKRKYPHLFLYSDEYLYPARMVLNHMGGKLSEFLCQQRKQHSVQGFVNYIANHNGFTLADLFSYCEKHNEDNGEDNCDGNNWNFSSNCGAEGRTRKKYVGQMRRKQMKNALAMVFLAQGVPLIQAGDEFGNSQNGNNNAYCQDNRIGWLNWKTGERYEWLREFVRDLAAFRRNHPMIASDEPMRQSDYRRKGLPDLSYHGENAWLPSVSADRQAVGLLYCGAYGLCEDGSEDDCIYVAYNFHSGLSHLALPKLPGKKKWYLIMNTAQEEAFLREKHCLADQQLFAAEGQSVCILLGK